jgi:polyisoprenoid-binding protein YceI
MRNTILIMIIFALGLAACASPTTTVAPAAVSPTEAVAEQQATATTAAVEPTATVAAPATEAATTEPASGADTSAAAPGVVVYKIVPGQSTVSYTVGETFFNENNRFNTAVGTTPQVSGEVTIDSADPKNSSISPIEIDISQFKSDSSRRDNMIRNRFLESSRYPIATFTPTSIDGLPDSYTPGQELTFKITGDLQIKETTKPVTFDVTAMVDNNQLIGTASTTILMSDFGVGPIQLAGILGTEDQVKLDMNFTAQP